MKNGEVFIKGVPFNHHHKAQLGNARENMLKNQRHDVHVRYYCDHYYNFGVHGHPEILSW